MPLGILSDEEFNRELNRVDEKVIIPAERNKPAEVRDSNLGKPNGTKNIPEDARKIIGEESILGASDAEIAKAFGISPQSIHAYKNGATSLATYNKPDVGLKKHIDSVKERITKRATNRINQAFNYITPDKLESMKARDLAGLAKDMSAIVKNMEPDSSNNNGQTNQVQFVFMAPRVKSESDYQVVTVND